MKCKQGYKDHKQGEKLRYPLENDVETILENVEDAFGDEEGSKEYEEDEDGKEVKEGDEKVRGVEEEALDSEVAQAEGTSEAPSEAPPVLTNVAVAIAAGAEAGSERDESEQECVPDSHAETPQDHTVSEK